MDEIARELDAERRDGGPITPFDSGAWSRAAGSVLGGGKSNMTDAKLLMDLMALAFQADITRISTFMMAREVSYRTFPQIGTR